MAFSATTRVRVTDQSSAYREKLGTVEVAKADSPVSLNEVRIDGFPVGQTVRLDDNQLTTTTLVSPVTY